MSPWDVEAREYLGTRQSEEAVRRGLAWLTANQLPDGHWSSGGYTNEVAITGLAVMAYLAAGHQPGRGRHGQALGEAVNYLLKSVRMDGGFAPPGLVRATNASGAGPPMYGHGFATLALAEVYGMTKRRDVREKLVAAIRLIESTQNRDGSPGIDGGWRYQPGQRDADLSVTVVQVLALRGAKNAGVRVSQETIDRAVGYMRRCANSDGGFNYQVHQQRSGAARTGAGVLSLIMAGLRSSEECRNGLEWLRRNPLSAAATSHLYQNEHYYYALYYVTQAMYQAGGAYWAEWYPFLRDRLVRTQAAGGSWGGNARSREHSASEAGEAYATAMACLVLQVPAGLLPIYQK